MKALWNIIKLELLANLRSRAFFLLTSASVLWMLVMPSVVKSDGTDEGARQLYVHYSLGGVFALVLVSLAAAAAGSLSRDRAAKRLQLTMVRPVPPSWSWRRGSWPARRMRRVLATTC